MKFQICSIGIIAIILMATACTKENKPLQEITSPANENSHLPFLESDSNGNLFLSWVETDTSSGQSTLRYSMFEDGNWTKPQNIASGDDWFINWADFPSILAQNGAITTAHLLKKIPGNAYSYNVNIYIKNEDGSWLAPITPHLDSTATEHGFVSMVPWKSNTLAIWLDGRRSHNRSDEEYFDLDKAMTLRSAVITSDGTISQQKRIDKSVCDCCNTSIAITSKGAIAAYRNRTDEEIRDIYTSRYENGEWTEPEAVYNDGWKIAACPVNGPAIAAQDSTVLVTWFTAAEGTSTVKAAISKDYGAHFSTPFILNDSTAVGRVNTVMDTRGSGYISWIEKGKETNKLKTKHIKSNGQLSEAITITNINSSRKSGFPQMALHDGKLFFAWTKVDPVPSVRTATFSLDRFDE